MTSLYFATTLAFNAPDRGFPWDDFRKILHGRQRMAGTKLRRNIAESFNPEYGRARTLQTTDRQTDRRICDSKDPNVT